MSASGFAERGSFGDLQRVLAIELECIGFVREAAQEEVVDHLFHEVADILDQGDFAVDIPRRPEAVEDLEAEPVGRLNGRGVEVGDGLSQPVPTGLHLAGRPPSEQLHELVVFVTTVAGGDVRQAVEGTDQPLAHSFTQLARRHPGEGDHEEAVDRQDAFRHVSRGERRDGERLARPRARLQEGHTGRQVPADFEGPGLGDAGAHRSTTPSRARSGSQMRCA